MKEIKSNRYARIIPVRLIKNQIVKVRDIPSLESKKIKSFFDSSISTSTEPSNKPVSNNITNDQVEKMSTNLSKKYHQLMDDIKIEKEMMGTVEENIGEYPNFDPFGPSGNLHSQSYISKTKKVLFKEKEENEVILKIVNSNLYLSLYNKTPPQKKFFRKSEVSQIIKIQNKFKGIFSREVEKVVDREKTHACILETMLLLVGRAYDNAIRKQTLKKLRKVFLDPFNDIGEEVLFEDKISFKLPDRFYNMESIIKLNTPKNSPKKKKF